MIHISLEDMMEAGAHFGHQTRRWNPKMAPFLYGVRSGIHIIDLGQTAPMAVRAFSALEEIVASGQEVLFVGTKNQAQPVIEEEAKRCNMPYITRRWLGGTLTNFDTIRRSVERLRELETRRENNDFVGLTKREKLGIDREILKLGGTLGGIKNVRKLPGALFVVDPNIERIAVHEANLLKIPVVGIVDSNCNPDPINFVIPANDDALRSIRMFAAKAADACLEGFKQREQRALLDAERRREEPADKGSRQARPIAGPGKAYVTDVDKFEAKESVESFSVSVEGGGKSKSEGDNGGTS